jgi:hypothetical protein
MNARRVHVHIDRIVVDGLPTSGRKRFLRALEVQLEELAESGLADATSSPRRRIGSLQAGQMRPGAGAEQAAGQVAAALRQRLGGGEQIGAEGPAMSLAQPVGQVLPGSRAQGCDWPGGKGDRHA